MQEDQLLYDPQPRRFIYRSVEPDSEHSHLRRRRTDGVLAPLAIKSPTGPQPLLFRMWLCIKVD